MYRFGSLVALLASQVATPCAELQKATESIINNEQARPRTYRSRIRCIMQNDITPDLHTVMTLKERIPKVIITVLYSRCSKRRNRSFEAQLPKVTGPMLLDPEKVEHVSASHESNETR